MNTVLLAALSFLLFLFAGVCYGAVLFLDAPTAPAGLGKASASSRPSQFAPRFVIAGIFALFLGVGANCISSGSSPFASRYGTMLVEAWAIAIVFFYWDRKAKMPAVGAVAMLIDCVVLGYSLTHTHAHVAQDPIIRNPIVSIHVLAILAANSLILIAAGCAALYLVQNRQLKVKSRTSALKRVPPLKTLDSVGYQCVAYALPLLTLSLVVLPLILKGGLAGPQRNWLLDPRIISTALLWVEFAVYLGARQFAGWRGVRLQYLLLLGILVAYAVYALPTVSAHRFN